MLVNPKVITVSTLTTLALTATADAQGLTYGHQSTAPAGWYPSDLAVADLDHDGILDVVTLESSGSPLSGGRTFHGAANGTLQP